jgi:RNA-directed DNA polymerase
MKSALQEQARAPPPQHHPRSSTWRHRKNGSHCPELRPDQITRALTVISPMLANVYLHHVLDRWWAEEIRPRLLGKGELVRYADDFVMVFQHRRDAERMMAVLPKRFGKYGLELHSEKTRMVRFVSPANRRYGGSAKGKPGSFDFLGFTHYWGRTRKGTWVAKRKTAKTRLRRTLKRANAWLRRRRHHPVKWQHKKLSQALNGHYAYFALTGNQRSMLSLRWQVICLWRKWLNRRSWRGQMPWEKFNKLLQHYPLPLPRAVRTASIGAKP